MRKEDLSMKELSTIVDASKIRKTKLPKKCKKGELEVINDVQMEIT